MNDIEFLSYVETPLERYMGIASILIAGIVLRYKVQQSKDGAGYFVTPPSYKEIEDGVEKWVEWHSIDSRIQSGRINALIRSHVSQYLSEKPTQEPQVEVNKVWENPTPPPNLPF